MYASIIKDLRTAYDRKVDERVEKPLEEWKIAARADFLARLQAAGKQSLLEIGAGLGQDSLFFQQNGLTVTCTDLSPAMVAYCRRQGLDAHVMDFAGLDFAPASFDALYARNCLLHVPHADFPAILVKLQALLKPGGLFYLGQYGGVDQEGVWAQDHYEPKRFYARFTDDQILAIVQETFELIEFRRVDVGESSGHFQSLVLRKCGTATSHE
jgi:SAM-dependent methyltransferase